MLIQVFSILKMKKTQLFIFALLCLNLLSVVNINSQMDTENDINNQLEEAISVKIRMKSLKTVLGKSDEEDWDNFLKYCDWKIDYLKDMETKIKKGLYTQDEYYKDMLVITKMDINCYANTRIKDHVKKWNQTFDFDYTMLNKIYSKSNTIQHIHQQYVDASTKYKILKQRVQKNMEVTEESILGHFLVNVGSDSLIAFLMPIFYILFTFMILSEYKRNNLFEFYQQVYNSKFKTYLGIISAIVISVVCIYFACFFITSIGLFGYKNYTFFSTKILVDTEHLFDFLSYPSDTNTLYYMGNKYYSASADFNAIPECLKLMSIGKALLLTLILDLIKLLFYVLVGLYIYLLKKRKTVIIVLTIGIYCISQFLLIHPILNPFAIIPSFSVVCGGYEATWLSSLLTLSIYSALFLILIKVKIKKVDF